MFIRSILFVALAASWCHAKAFGAGRPLELKDYYRVETANDPSLSPDGRWVALVRTYIVEPENRRQSEIWLAPADGSAPATRISLPSFSSTRPRFSPDGKLLAFESRRKAPGQTEDAGAVWFLRLEAPGGEAFQIPGVDGTPVFSPDNLWIAFVKRTPAAERPPPPPASELERQIEERFKGRIYDWMNFRFDQRGYLPDPRDPRASPPEEIYLVSRSGSTARQITSLGVSARSPVWRPDSGALAFVADTDQRNEHTYERPDLFLVDLDGKVARLTDDGFEHAAPAWSPDGRSLAFLREQGLDLILQSHQRFGSPVDLHLISAAGGPSSSLTTDWDLIPGAPTFSPDGRYLYYGAEVGGNTHLFKATLDGKVEQVTGGDRRLSGFSFGSDFKTMAYSASEPTRPGEVFSARVDGGGEKKLTSFNDAWLADVSLKRPERILFPSRDGTEIEGWVLLPPGLESKGATPLILRIHGGPHGAYGNDFAFDSQLVAARGHVVLYTNPRGSTGYGEKFLWATWGGWGVRDYEDVMAGVDHVLKKYPIDPKRLGVTGYSYGGFMTNWVIGHTERFAAAVSGASISNWVSDYGTADIPRTKESEFYGPPWRKESFDLMVKLSPITYVANVKTPTLFVHGESDHRVPIAEAEQMYTALKKLNVPAKFVRYPESYHGGWTPWNTVHRYYQEIKWWDEWLQAKREPTQQ